MMQLEWSLQRALIEAQLAPMPKSQYLSHVRLLPSPPQVLPTHKGDHNEGACQSITRKTCSHNGGHDVVMFL
jgi:hypothetical protein